MAGKATGMPVDVRIRAISDGENSKLEVAFAEVNLASTRLGSASDKPKSILMKRRGAVDMEVRWSKPSSLVPASGIRRAQTTLVFTPHSNSTLLITPSILTSSHIMYPIH
jgi:hypothetical protein